MNQQLWGEMLDVLKDIGGYLTKQDAEQTRAKLDKPPRTGENQADEPLVGGEDSVGKPGSGVAKSLRKSGMKAGPIPHKAGFLANNGGGNAPWSAGDLVDNDFADKSADGFTNGMEDEAGMESGGYDDEGEEGLGGGMEGGDMEGDMGDGGEDTAVAEANDPATLDAIIASAEAKKAELEGGGGEMGGPSGMDMNEMKSLLKDIRSSLIAKSSTNGQAIAAEIKKSVQPLIREETQRMMRKMGFRPSRPDVSRFGIDEDTNALRKSADSKVGGEKDVADTMDKMSGMSWQQLGQLREHMGQFNPFNR